MKLMKPKLAVSFEPDKPPLARLALSIFAAGSFGFDGRKSANNIGS
jgi:hypothetical protein